MEEFSYVQVVSFRVSASRAPVLPGRRASRRAAVVPLQRTDRAGNRRRRPSEAPIVVLTPQSRSRSQCRARRQRLSASCVIVLVCVATISRMREIKLPLRQSHVAFLGRDLVSGPTGISQSKYQESLVWNGAGQAGVIWREFG
jgi:hypothetical protein